VQGGATCEVDAPIDAQQKPPVSGSAEPVGGSSTATKGSDESVTVAQPVPPAAVPALPEMGASDQVFAPRLQASASLAAQQNASDDGCNFAAAPRQYAEHGFLQRGASGSSGAPIDAPRISVSDRAANGQQPAANADRPSTTAAKRLAPPPLPPPMPPQTQASQEHQKQQAQQQQPPPSTNKRGRKSYTELCQINKKMASEMKALHEELAQRFQKQMQHSSQAPAPAQPTPVIATTAPPPAAPSTPAAAASSSGSRGTKRKATQKTAPRRNAENAARKQAAVKRFAGAKAEPIGAPVDVPCDNRRIYPNGIKLSPVNEPGAPAAPQITLAPGARLSLCLSGERDPNAVNDQPKLTQVELAAPYTALNSDHSTFHLLVVTIENETEVHDRAFELGDLADVIDTSHPASPVVSAWIQTMRDRAKLSPPSHATRSSVRGHGQRNSRRSSVRSRRRVTPTKSNTDNEAPTATSVSHTSAAATACHHAEQQAYREGVRDASALIRPVAEAGLFSTLIAAKASPEQLKLFQEQLANYKK